MRSPNQNFSVSNKQRQIAVDSECLSRFLAKAAERLQLSGEVSVVLVDETRMCSLNRQYRGLNRSTDVLAFPYEVDLWEEDQAYLGDVVLCVSQADRHKRADLMTELKLLALHGLLHLIGHDHECDDGEMQALESALREEFELR